MGVLEKHKIRFREMQANFSSPHAGGSPLRMQGDEGLLSAFCFARNLPPIDLHFASTTSPHKWGEEFLGDFF